jgi:TusA-related sulfurtransferase
VNGTATAETFLRHLGQGAFDSLAELLDRDVVMRALLPGGPQEYSGREEVKGRFEWWFGAGESLQVMHSEARAVADRVEISYGFRILDAMKGDKAGWRAIEQRAFCDVGDLIERIDLVCTGFRPVVQEGNGPHRFDAGAMGCADGLSQEFKRWVRSIEVGDIMEVVTNDPAAKEDLPSLARLMGNKVMSVQTLEDGRLEITVERGR